MTSFPMLVSRDNGQTRDLRLYAVRRRSLTEQPPGQQRSGKSEDPWPLSSDAVIVLESDAQTVGSSASPAKDVRKVLRDGRFQSYQILAPVKQDARWFIISFLTVPKRSHDELRTKFEAYTKQIFENPKFNPVFSYLSPLEPGSDVLLSVWGFPASQDADVYMPSSEHVAFGNSVQSYFTHVDFFQASLVDFTEAKL